MTGGIGSGVGFFEERRDLRFDFREVIGDDIPEDVIIDPEIPVDDFVPECCHVTPRDILMLCFYWVGDIFCGFSNNFNCAPDGMSKIIIMEEIVVGPVF